MTNEDRQMVFLRKTLVASLFVLLVPLSFALLWLPVIRGLLSFHHEWAGFPEWLFPPLWIATDLALSLSLVAGAFFVIGLIVRRFWPAR
jgi:uncharacterized membrane protein YphA (DoxX/SURF4 family)